MIARSTVTTFLALTLISVLPAMAVAHEGHDHKIMGTVTKIEKSNLTLKAQDGKTMTVEVKDETRILRDQTRLALADIAVGDRVVVTVGSGKEPLVAKEVRVGTASSPRK